MNKINLTIKTKSGYREVEGYKVDIVYKGKPIDNVAVRKDGNEWVLNCMATGQWFGGRFRTRKEAIEAITVELMEDYLACLERKDTKLAIDRLNDYKKNMAQNAK